MNEKFRENRYVASSESEYTELTRENREELKEELKESLPELKKLFLEELESCPFISDNLIDNIKDRVDEVNFNLINEIQKEHTGLFRGIYDFITDEIKLKEKANKGTIIHELLHAVSSRLMNKKSLEEGEFKVLVGGLSPGIKLDLEKVDFDSEDEIKNFFEHPEYVRWLEEGVTDKFTRDIFGEEGSKNYDPYVYLLEAIQEEAGISDEELAEAYFKPFKKSEQSEYNTEAISNFFSAINERYTSGIIFYIHVVLGYEYTPKEREEIDSIDKAKEFIEEVEKEYSDRSLTDLVEDLKQQ
ncbi:MAG: hypothetical protein ABEJ24_00360 [Candidatus Magasanikbacteria bacterium]